MDVLRAADATAAPADPTKFTGSVWRTDLIEPADPSRLAGSRFDYWHGATATTSFAHLAITAGGGTTWLHKVSEEDYRRAPADWRA